MIYIILASLIILGFVANKEGKLTGYLSIVVAGILGYVALKKNPVPDALKENDATLDKVHTLDDAIRDNHETIAVEEQKQKDLQKDIDNAKNVANDVDNVVDFLNKR